MSLKDIIKQSKYDSVAKDLKLGVLPNGFCFSNPYNNQPSINYPNNGLGDDGFIESHWYNANKIIGLEPEISVDLQSESNDDGKYKKLDDLVMKFLGKYYGLTDKNGEINESDRPLLQYIKSLYSYKSSFDYAGVDDINNYIYSVKIELK